MSNNKDHEAIALKKTFKLALVASILRCKPNNLSVKEFARQLVDQVKNQEPSWKSKYDEVCRQLHKAKQEIDVLRLRNGVEVGTHCSAPVNFGIGLLEGSKNETINARFLSSVVSLKQWNGMLIDESRSFVSIKDDIISCLREFETCVGEVKLNAHSIALITQNMETIAQGGLAKHLDVDVQLFDVCSSIVQRLITLIVATSDIKNVVCEQVVTLVVLVSQTCERLRDVVLDNLINVTCGYSTLLSNTKFTELDPGKFERMYFICDTLTQVFTSTHERWPAPKKFVEYSKQLDEGIKSITNAHPMYGHQVWLISSRMADVSASTPEDDFLTPVDSL